MQMSVNRGELRAVWGWFVALGVILVLLGVLAFVMDFYSTIAGVAFFGGVLCAAGIVQLVGTLRAHGASDVFLHLLVGIVDLIAGLVIVTHPLAGALLLTLVIAAMLLVGGLFRLISALAVRYAHYGWSAFSGLLSCLLGVLLWIQWPVSGLWFIGFCIGLNLMFLGASWIALGTTARQVIT